MNNVHLFLNKVAVCRKPHHHHLPHSCSSSTHYRGQTQAEKTNGLSPMFHFPNSTSTKAKENTNISHKVGVGLVSWANIFCPQGSDNLWIPRYREVGYILPHSPTSSRLPCHCSRPELPHGDHRLLPSFPLPPTPIPKRVCVRKKG